MRLFCHPGRSGWTTVSTLKMKINANVNENYFRIGVERNRVETARACELWRHHPDVGEGCAELAS